MPCSLENNAKYSTIFPISKFTQLTMPTERRAYNLKTGRECIPPITSNRVRSNNSKLFIRALILKFSRCPRATNPEFYKPSTNEGSA